MRQTERERERENETEKKREKERERDAKRERERERENERLRQRERERERGIQLFCNQSHSFLITTGDSRRVFAPPVLDSIWRDPRFGARRINAKM